MDDVEIPKFCNLYEISIIGETVILHFYYKKHRPEEKIMPLSSVSFDKEQCKIFLLTALGEIKKDESPPERL